MCNLLDEVWGAVQSFRNGQALVEPEGKVEDGEEVLGEIPEDLRPLYSAFSVDCDNSEEEHRQLSIQIVKAFGEATAELAKLTTKESLLAVNAKMKELMDEITRQDSILHERNRVLRTCFWASMDKVFPKLPAGTSMSVRKGWKVVAVPDKEPQVEIVGLDRVPAGIRSKLAAALASLHN